MKRIWIWVGGGLALMVVAVAVSILTVRWLAGPPAGNQPAEAAAAEVVEGQEMMLDRFVTNLREPGTAIDVTLVLLVPGDKEAEQVEEMQSRLRAAIIGMLRELSPEELVGSQGQAVVAERAQNVANNVLGPETVIEVLVTDMVTQP